VKEIEAIMQTDEVTSRENSIGKILNLVYAVLIE
jgi:hypothetical protein